MTSTVPLRFALYADLMVLFGLPFFGLVLPINARFDWRRWVAGTAVAGTLLSVAAMLAMISGMAGQSIGELDHGLVSSLVTDTAIGHAFCVRTLALFSAIVIGLAPRLSAPRRLMLAATTGGIALGTLAWTGHGAMDDGGAGWLHLIADIAHLLAAGIWMGALVALSLLVGRDLTDEDHRATAIAALHGFGRIGTAVVTTLIVSGAINLWALLVRSGAALLPLTDYGLLLVLKAVAFVAMLGLAGLNRWTFTPALARGSTRIRLSLALELGLGIAVIGLVAVVGTLAPTG